MFDWDDVCTRSQLKLEPLIKIPPGFFHGNEFVTLVSPHEEAEIC